MDSWPYLAYHYISCFIFTIDNFRKICFLTKKLLLKTTIDSKTAFLYLRIDIDLSVCFTVHFVLSQHYGYGSIVKRNTRTTFTVMMTMKMIARNERERENVLEIEWRLICKKYPCHRNRYNTKIWCKSTMAYFRCLPIKLINGKLSQTIE